MTVYKNEVESLETRNDIPSLLVLPLDVVMKCKPRKFYLSDLDFHRVYYNSICPYCGGDLSAKTYPLSGHFERCKSCNVLFKLHYYDYIVESTSLRQICFGYISSVLRKWWKEIRLFCKFPKYYKQIKNIQRENKASSILGKIAPPR